MAEEDTGQDRTEEATPKRKEDARKKGDIPRSKDMTTMMMLMAASISMLTLGTGMLEGIASTMKTFFVRAADVNIAARELPGIFLGALNSMIINMLPFVLVMVFVALFSPMLLSGWNFSVDAIKFKASKMNPLSGIKRVFGPNSLIELFQDHPQVFCDCSGRLFPDPEANARDYEHRAG